MNQEEKKFKTSSKLTKIFNIYKDSKAQADIELCKNITEAIEVVENSTKSPEVKDLINVYDDFKTRKISLANCEEQLKDMKERTVFVGIRRAKEEDRNDIEKSVYKKANDYANIAKALFQ